MRYLLAAAVSILVVCQPAGFAQSQAGFLAPAPALAAPVVNQPYSAELVATSVRPLADGTSVTRTVPNLLLYRDSAGRTRTDGPILVNPETGAQTLAMVVIVDPVEGFQYVLDPRLRVAHRRRLEAPAPPDSRAGASPAPPAVPLQVTAEPLGSDWIESVPVEGTRLTVSQAATGGAAQVLSRTEYWTSPDLGEMVLRRQANPDGGEASNRLIHILRAEPDLALFHPPAEYRVVDETADFRIVP